jgi:hypothetical protein
MQTVRSPTGFGRRGSWHGLALLATEEDLELWQEQIEEEDISPGSTAVGMATSMGGSTARMLNRLSELKVIDAAIFPDPEPVEALAAAAVESKPIWLVEPDLDDEGWMELTIASATAQVKIRNLLLAIGANRRYNRQVKHILRHESSRTDSQSNGVESVIFNRGKGDVSENGGELEVEGSSDKEDAFESSIPLSKSIEQQRAELVIAAALSAAWWQQSRMHLDIPLRQSFDNRLAGRLRGALQALRDDFNREQVDGQATTEPVLLAPVGQVWLPHLVDALERGVKSERVEKWKSGGGGI